MSIQRLFFLDALKGILIILVILGHAIQGYEIEYQHDILFRIIYSFHMPLFFLISGYLTYKGYYDKKLIRKRFIQCIVPFLVWAILLPIYKYHTFDVSRTLIILKYPDNGLWFLYNLFFYCLIFNKSERFADLLKCWQEVVLAILYVIILIIGGLLRTEFNAVQICWYIPFFAIGYYIRKYPSVMHNRFVSIIAGGGI